MVRQLSNWCIIAGNYSIESSKGFLLFSIETSWTLVLLEIICTSCIRRCTCILKNFEFKDTRQI